MKDSLILEYGSFKLARDPRKSHLNLRAWDAADEYLLGSMVPACFSTGKRLKLLIVNDSFGALTVAMAGMADVFTVADSIVTEEAVRYNLAANNLPPDSTEFVSPLVPVFPKTDAVLLKIPGNLEYLKYLLSKIQMSEDTGIPVISAGMTKLIHSSTMRIFEQMLEGVHSTLAWKKARIISGWTEGRSISQPDRESIVTIPETGIRMVNLPGVFSYGRLDGGTAFFLRNFPDLTEPPEFILDMGCGDGTLAVTAALKWPGSGIICTDSSRIALESAERSFELNGIRGNVRFIQDNAASSVPDGSIDLVVCNPPFHSSGAIDQGPAEDMFSAAFRILKSGGRMAAVKNRHLGYNSYIISLFGNCETVVAGKKYEILMAVRK